MAKRDYNKDKIICECGIEILRTSKARHITTDKHINALSRRTITPTYEPVPVVAPPVTPIVTKVSQSTQTDFVPDYRQLYEQLKAKNDRVKELLLPDVEYNPDWVQPPPPPPPISVNVYKCKNYYILSFNENDELFNDKQLSIENKLSEIKASLRKNLKTQLGDNIDIGWIVTSQQLEIIRKYIQSIGITIFNK